MSKSSILDQNVKQYILDRIDNSGYSDTPLATNAERIAFLSDTFQSEYGWQIKRMSQVAALREWFQGLPSSCNIVFTNHDILALAVKWGSISADASEKQRDVILENYFNLMANKTAQLFNGYRVPKDAKIESGGCALADLSGG